MGLREQAEAGIEELRKAGVSAAAIADSPAIREIVAPDLAASGIPAELDVPVHVAWSRVMGEVQWIAKAGRADKYNFRGIDAVRNAVGPALRKHGVAVMPISTVVTHERNSRTGGGSMTTSWATVRYAIFGPRGDRFGGPDFYLEAAGEGFDVGDKSAMKAQSVAERTMYIVALCIPTDQPEMDPEHGPQYEIAPAPAPTAADYETEILDDKTSVGRLQQIKTALDGNRALGMAEVDLMDGRRLKLADLVREVGRRRMGGTK